MQRWAVIVFFIAFLIPFGGCTGELPRQQVVMAKSPPKQDGCNRNLATGLCPQEAGGVWRELLKFSVSGHFMQPSNQTSASKSR